MQASEQIGLQSASVLPGVHVYTNVYVYVHIYIRRERQIALYGEIKKFMRGDGRMETERAIGDGESEGTCLEPGSGSAQVHNNWDDWETHQHPL